MSVCSRHEAAAFTVGPPTWVPLDKGDYGWISAFFEPDLLVQTASGQFATLGLKDERSYPNRRYASLDDIIRKDHGLAADLDVGVNMYHVYHHLFETEFQFTKRVKPRILDFKGGDAMASAFFEAAFGCFPKGKTLDYLPKVFKKAFAAETVEPSFDVWQQIADKGAGFPLYYTTRDMDVKFDSRLDPSIFIFDPLSAADTIDFWNFRLFTRDVLPVNVHWLAQSRDLILKHIRGNYRLLPTNPNGVMIHTAIHVARSLDADTVIAALKLQEAGLLEHSVSCQGWYPSIWQEPDDEHQIVRSTPALLTVKSRQVELQPSQDDRVSIRYPLQAPEFDPVQRGHGPAWINTIRVRQYGSQKSIAVAMPSAGFEARPFYPSRGTSDQFFTREGFVTFHHFAHDAAFLTLATAQQAIESWLAAAGIEAKSSDAGRVADQVIASVGGLNGVAILREREIIQLLDKMARSRREWPDGSSDEYEGRTASAQTWQQTLKRVQQRLFGRWKTLDRLVSDGILQLGFAIRCTHCTQENWYSLDDVASEVRCSRCRKMFLYPQGEPQRRDVWKYRVVGPFATPHYARGAYAVALTLRFLDQEVRLMDDFTFSTGLELKRDGRAIEADFFAWQGRHNFGRADKDPTTLLGECKSLGADAFKAADVGRLRELALMLPGAYLIAATMKDELSQDEVALLKRLAKWGWLQPKPSPLIVLTGIELFGEGPLSHIWSEAGGRVSEVAKHHRHIFNFPALAAATQEAHLGLEPNEVSDMRYHVSRQARMRRQKPTSR